MITSLRMCSFGQLGSGKSLSIVYELLKWHARFPSSIIYCNIPLIGLDYVKIDNPEVIFDIEKHSIVFLDELWHIADSRKSMSLVNDIMNMLLLRSRKKDWFVGYTQQHFKQTDLRIRYVTELWIEPHMRGKWLKMTYYSLDGTYMGERVVDGSKYWSYYDHEADPFTLNVEKLRRLWEERQQRF